MAATRALSVILAAAAAAAAADTCPNLWTAANVCLFLASDYHPLFSPPRRSFLFV